MTGTIPPEAGGPSRLRWLGLYDNALIGDIPVELGSPTRLEAPSLENNQLSETIPLRVADRSDHRQT